jgi:4-alpha-glucanotransferase
VLASVANTAVVPLQDVLGLGTEARMNLPNSTEGNWAWRCKAGALTEEVRRRLKELTDLYGRAKDISSAAAATESVESV